MSKILIGVDALARSEDAIALACSLAQATTAGLLVATVVADPARHGAPTREGARLTVQRMSGLLAGIVPERIHTSIVESRSPAEGLYELAEAEDVDLIVVGSTHVGQFDRVRPGGTGERLLMGGQCAVAIAPYGYRQREPGPLRRIGVAYDGGAPSRAALRAGVAAARALHVPLEAITAIPSDVHGPAGSAGVRDVVADVRHDLDAAIASLPGDVSAEGVILEGHPYRALAGKTPELDLLFVGSRRYGPNRTVMLGGTSGPLIRRAQCPVVVLPRGASDELARLFAARAASAA